MADTTDESRNVIVERELAHPPERIWRALTQPDLIRDWLMPADFRPAVGHRFQFRADWGSVECEVLEVEPPEKLSYSWGDDELETVVTWTLSPSGVGTRLRMEQSGFRSDQPRHYHGARAGWPRFLDGLAALLAKMQ